MTAPATKEHAALARILALIKQHGGEDASVNYQLLCAIQKIARTTIERK